MTQFEQLWRFYKSLTKPNDRRVLFFTALLEPIGLLVQYDERTDRVFAVVEEQDLG